jgi:hypothetical protein
MAEPTLRWAVKVNKVTAKEVREYAARNSVSQMTAKHLMQARKQPVLQQNINDIWVDVPTVEVPHG